MSMKFFATAALALAGLSAFGQSGPADVPTGHWARPAVENLYRLGILRGYPDSTFKGSRPVSRYELATATDAFRSLALRQTESLASEIAELERQIRTRQGDSSIADRAALRSDLQALRTDIDGLRQLSGEVNSLRGQFESMSGTLSNLRQDLAEMRKKIRQ